ncbi:MAG TPA: hypothetical protein VIL44_02965 [Micromonospora sp.]|nr:MAG: hypothetical protein DIU79_11250 [Actinomycetota bacterium]
MNVERRVHRYDIGERGAGQRVPRLGGRTVAQRPTRGGIVELGHRPARPRAREIAARRPARQYATEGSAALQPMESLRVWDSSAERAVGREIPAQSTPRLRVAPPMPVVAPRAPFVALVLVLVVGGVLGILLVNTKINENAFRLDTLREQQASLDIREQQLKNEIAEYEAPGNLAAQARRLGLVESGTPAFIRLPDGRVIGVPQPAGSAQPTTSAQPTASQSETGR